LTAKLQKNKQYGKLLNTLPKKESPHVTEKKSAPYGKRVRSLRKNTVLPISIPFFGIVKFSMTINLLGQDSKIKAGMPGPSLLTLFTKEVTLK